jgi:pyruvate decarboxylase
MPLDLCWQHVPASLLDKPIDLSLPRDEAAIDRAVDAIIERLKQAHNPALFVDGLVSRYSARAECRAIADKLKLPTYSANMGKAIIDETADYFAGMYQGAISDPEMAEAFEKSDCLLVLGNINADTNSGGFSRKIRPDSSIEVNVDDVVVSPLILSIPIIYSSFQINEKTYSNTNLKPLLARLAERLSSIQITQPPIPKALPKPPPHDSNTKTLTQSFIWDRIASFTRPNDVVLAETGTASFGIVYSRLPENIRFVTQTYYGSIGYATPAALGTDLALQELHAENSEPRGRTVLITGDGSLTLTMQEIGTMITEGLKPIIIIVNNRGYTIERVIHGARQPYNTTIPIDFAAMLKTYCHPEPEAAFFKANTKAELDEIFSREHVFGTPKYLTVVELVLEPLDAPWRLIKQISIRGPQYKKHLQDEGWLVPEDKVEEQQNGRIGVNG